MGAAHRDNTILLNGVVYEIVPQSMRTSELVPAPSPIQEGNPAYAEHDDTSRVGWDDWQDGAGQITYDPRLPARLATAKNLIYDVPGQITLSMLQQATTGIDSAPTKIAQLLAGARMVALTAAKVFLKDDGAESWTAKLSSVTPTDVIAWGDGTDTLYLVAMGNAAAYRYTTDITASPPTWVTSTLSGDDQKADFWAAGPAGTGSNGGTLWKAVKPNKVYATDDPKETTGHWTSAYLVGGSETSVTAFGVYDNRLLVGKEEGLYWVKPDGTVEMLIDMRGAIDSQNCKGMVSWGGYLFVPWVQGLFVFKGGNLLNLGEVTASFRDVGPHVGSQVAGDVRGRVVALCPSPTRLYAVTESESGAYSVNRYNGNPTPGLGWNLGFLWLDSNACQALGWEQPASGNPRLYFGYGSSIRYVVLPKYGDNPLLDSAVSYCASGAAEMPEYESPLRAMAKAMLYEAIDVERTATGTRYVDIAHDIDGSGSWSSLRRVDADGLTRAYFSTTDTGRRIKLQLALATADSTNTPRVRLLEHHFELRPQRRQRWTFQVIAGSTKDVPLVTAGNVRAGLIAARDSTQPVNFEDRYGNLYDVFVEAVGEVEQVKPAGATEPIAVVSVSVKQFKSAVGAFYVGDENAIVGSAYAA